MTLLNHGKNPMDIVWYYVKKFNDYFPFVKHQGDNIVLDGEPTTGQWFEVTPGECRMASYDEARAFYMAQRSDT